jgi:hypothetical protein
VATIYKRKQVEGVISHMPGVQAELRGEANKLRSNANTRLESIRAATQWEKYDKSSAHLMKIVVRETTGKYTQDYWVTMESDRPEDALAGAFEYGHAPSGIFGPKGKFAHVKTQAPKARYLMTMTYVQA